MIVILDNAEQYSQHQIKFIDIGSLPVEPAVELLLRYMNDNLSYEGVSIPFVHAVVEALEWRDPRSLLPVAKLWQDIREHSCAVCACRDKQLRVLYMVDPDYETEKEKIYARPWTPEECPCTCVSGELYALAQEEKR